MNLRKILKRVIVKLQEKMNNEIDDAITPKEYEIMLEEIFGEKNMHKGHIFQALDVFSNTLRNYEHYGNIKYRDKKICAE